MEPLRIDSRNMASHPLPPPASTLLAPAGSSPPAPPVAAAQDQGKGKRKGKTKNKNSTRPSRRATPRKRKSARPALLSPSAPAKSPIKSRAKTPRLGFNSKFPAINQEYSRLRDFFFQHVRIFQRAPVTRAGVTGEVLTWADTYRLTILGSHWELSTKDWATNTWTDVPYGDASEEEDGDIDSIARATSPSAPNFSALLGITLFPIKISPRSAWFGPNSPSQSLFNASIAPILAYLKSPLASTSLYDAFAAKYDPSPAPPPAPPSAGQPFAVASGPTDFEKSFAVMSNLLRTRLAGRSSTLNKHKQLLSGAEQAYRGLIKALWENMDRDVLSLALSVSWREPLTLRKLITIARHQDDVRAIAKEHRNLLPILNHLPPRLWSPRYFTSPEAFTAVVKQYIPENSAQGNLALARSFFASPFSVNYWALRSSAVGPALAYTDRLRALKLPTWVQANLLRSSRIIANLEVRSSVSFQAKVSSFSPAPAHGAQRHDQITSDRWLQYCTDVVAYMIDYYKRHQQFSLIQSFSSDFIATTCALFDGQSSFQDLPVADVLAHPQPTALAPELQNILPSGHPWKAILNRASLDLAVPDAEPIPGNPSLASPRARI